MKSVKCKSPTTFTLARLACYASMFVILLSVLRACRNHVVPILPLFLIFSGCYVLGKFLSLAWRGAGIMALAISSQRVTVREDESD